MAPGGRHRRALAIALGLAPLGASDRVGAAETPPGLRSRAVARVGFRRACIARAADDCRTVGSDDQPTLCYRFNSDVEFRTTVKGVGTVSPRIIGTVISFHLRSHPRLEVSGRPRQQQIAL